MSSHSLSMNLHDKLRGDRLRDLNDRETQLQKNRETLRDYAVQLREPNDHYTRAPANKSSPSFKIGDVPNFPYPVEHRAEAPGMGQLSPPAYKSFMQSMDTAARSTDVRTRDVATQKAAKTVARDWLEGKGHKNVKEEISKGLLHEMRAQVTFHTRELGQKLGLGSTGSSLVSYSLERALEREGFKVLANHAVDKVADVFKGSTASVAAATGVRHAMEKNLNKSMSWLASHGVTKDALKQTLSKHGGKISAVMQLADNPEVVQRAAQIIANSDKGVDMVIKLATDDELRKAVGTLALSTGQATASLPGVKGASSIAIAAGSMMRGDSMEETGRHVFIAAMTVAGGALGGVAGAPAGPVAIATAVIGAEVGAYVGEKVLNAYDYVFGEEPTKQNQGKQVTNQEVQDSMKVLGDRGMDAAKAGVGSAKELASDSSTRDKVADIGKEYAMSRG